jgi:hypothetical protein
LARDWSPLVIAGFIGLASAIMTIGSRTHVHDADSLMPAIMSAQRLTWYYWDQDRFGNLLPFLASPFRPISLNLHFQIWLRHVCAFLSAAFVLEVVGDRDHWYERFFAAVVVLLIAGHFFFLPFSGAALAQPISFAVFVAGVWLSRAPGERPLLRWARTLAVVAIFWVAFFVNISLIAFAVPLVLALWGLADGRSGPLSFGSGRLAVLAAAAGAWIHSRFFLPRTPSTLDPAWSSLNDAASAMLSEVNLLTLVLLLLGAGAIAAAGACIHRRSLTLVVPLEHWLAPCIVILSVALYANSAWVRQNGNASRYYALGQLFVLVLPATWAVSLVIASEFKAPRGAGLALRAALPIVAIMLVGQAAGWPAPLLFAGPPANDILAVNRDLTHIMPHIPPDRPLIAVGRYWIAVPLVYARLKEGEHESYAVTDHSGPVRDDVKNIVPGRRFTLVCLEIGDERCLHTLVGWLGLEPLIASRSRLFDGPLASGGSFSVFDMDPPAQ